MILAILPTQGVSEMTWPTTDATSLTLKILQSSLRKRSMLLFSFETLRSVTEIRP